MILMSKAQCLLDLHAAHWLFKRQHQPLDFPGNFPGDFAVFRPPTEIEVENWHHRSSDLESAP
jgi:hypothetical protein